MTAPLQVRAATFPPVGFSNAPSGRAWGTVCRPCGSGGVPMLIARSSSLDRPGWHACMATAHAHITQHTQGGRL
ncbi:hypothetical protein [Streptomyces sp. Amel2xC10]|uniref:hypothetical protein n=1 Tax=Streptomyces sp. Amel2xC10 TaxID=1305826 RepID=UPI000A08FEE2|nr:hypothetical protein [Streptomyces sp. Amel2xC10]SMF86386.1 hypothetical protein SAMN02745830_07160 [Streptomyces sp. Amel2xC10]